MNSAESATLIDHLTALTQVTAAFSDALDKASPERKPATFDAWTLGELAAHLGGVHRWAADIVDSGLWAARDNEPVISVPPAQWYDASRSRLLETLEATDPERGCWTHDPDDHTVRYWRRRQLHEALVHLWDARSAAVAAAAPLPDIAPEVCADGINEALPYFRAGRRTTGQSCPGDLRCMPSTPTANGRSDRPGHSTKAPTRRPRHRCRVPPVPCCCTCGAGRSPRNRSRPAATGACSRYSGPLQSFRDHLKLCTCPAQRQPMP